ncbi:MAG: hypothetical protein KDL31_13010, partial [Kiritimatiellae bacterium]|nr:hypothetical protein [Kiritimatiellia bacterium]
MKTQARRALAGMVCVFCVMNVRAGTPGIEWTCPTDKTLSCEEAWLFNEPLATSGCPVSGGYVDLVILSTVTNGTCPTVITRTWQASDYCGNTSTCSQAVTLIDTYPPVALCSGFNFVPNPGFDDLAQCPDFVGQVPYAAPWYTPTTATPDLFQACSTSTLVSVPVHAFGDQAPYDGNGYAGAILYNGTVNDLANSYREYLQVPLYATLAPGQLYRISFQVSLAETSKWAVANIGAHVSIGPVVNDSSYYGLPVSPQVFNPATNLLTSTSSWVEIAGTFVASGGEDTLTIGNFQSDAGTANVPFNSSGFRYAYYFIDAVTLQALCEPDVTGKTVICGTPWTFDTPTAVDRCAGTNVSVGIQSTVTSGICPLEISRTWTLSDSCGNSGTWEQVVKVVEIAPPDVSCGCLLDSALDLLATNGCEGTVPDLTSLTQCYANVCDPLTTTQSPLAGTVLGPGVHAVTVTVENCSGLATTCEVPFQVIAPAPALSCPTNFTVLTCDTNAVVHFAVSATGNEGPVVCSPPSGSAFPLGPTVVTCVATSACGGVAECSFTVTVKPPKTRWGCGIVGVGIGVAFGPTGGATTALRSSGPDSPAVEVTPGPGGLPDSGLALSPGPAETLTFTTVLDFESVPGAGMDIVSPPEAGAPDGTTLLSVRSLTGSNYVIRAGGRGSDDPAALFRTTAVTTNGDLLNSITYSAAEALTNETLVIAAQPGVTNCRLTVELNLRNGSITLSFAGTVTPSALGRKGWDGCIYGPDRPVKKPQARVVMIPPTPPGLPPVTDLFLYSSGWPVFSVEQPEISPPNAK